MTLWRICKCLHGRHRRRGELRERGDLDYPLFAQHEHKRLCDPVHPHTTLSVVPALVTKPSYLNLPIYLWVCFQRGLRETSGPMSADGGSLGLIFWVLLWATVDVTRFLVMQITGWGFLGERSHVQVASRRRLGYLGVTWRQPEDVLSEAQEGLSLKRRRRKMLAEK